MSGLGDKNASMRMREVIARIARATVNEMRPENRIGKVYSYDAATKSARILFAGETISTLLKVHVSDHLIPGQTMQETWATQGYNAPSDIVRIGGSGGQYYIVDYISGSPRPVFSAVSWITDTDWIPVTLLNGWTNYPGWEPAALRRHNGLVFMRGLIQSGTTTDGTQILNLPVGYRPSATGKHVSTAIAGGTGVIKVRESGTIDCGTPVSSTWTSLSITPWVAEK